MPLCHCINYQHHPRVDNLSAAKQDHMSTPILCFVYKTQVESEYLTCITFGFTFLYFPHVDSLHFILVVPFPQAKAEITFSK